MIGICSNSNNISSLIGINLILTDTNDALTREYSSSSHKLSKTGDFQISGCICSRGVYHICPVYRVETMINT